MSILRPIVILRNVLQLTNWHGDIVAQTFFQDAQAGNTASPKIGAHRFSETTF